MSGQCDKERSNRLLFHYDRDKFHNPCKTKLSHDDDGENVNKNSSDVVYHLPHLESVDGRIFSVE